MKTEIYVTITTEWVERTQSYFTTVEARNKARGKPWTSCGNLHGVGRNRAGSLWAYAQRQELLDHALNMVDMAAERARKLAKRPKAKKQNHDR